MICLILVLWLSHAVGLATMSISTPQTNKSLFLNDQLVNKCKCIFSLEAQPGYYSGHGFIGLEFLSALHERSRSDFSYLPMRWISFRSGHEHTVQP